MAEPQIIPATGTLYVIWRPDPKDPDGLEEDEYTYSDVHVLYVVGVLVPEQEKTEVNGEERWFFNEPLWIATAKDGTLEIHDNRHFRDVYFYCPGDHDPRFAVDVVVKRAERLRLMR